MDKLGIASALYHDEVDQWISSLVEEGRPDRQGGVLDHMIVWVGVTASLNGEKAVSRKSVSHAQKLSHIETSTYRILRR